MRTAITPDGLAPLPSAALGRGPAGRRLGPEAMIEGQDFGEPLAFGSATVWFHSAGPLRCPRIASWRIHKPASQADRVAQVHALLPGAAQGEQT